MIFSKWSISVWICVFSVLTVVGCYWKSFKLGRETLQLFLPSLYILRKKDFGKSRGEGGGVECCHDFVCVCALSCLVVSDSATPWTVARQAPLSWDFPGKNTGVGCHSLQGIFPAQLLTLISCIGRKILYHWVTWEAPAINLGSRYWCYLVRRYLKLLFIYCEHFDGFLWDVISSSPAPPPNPLGFFLCSSLEMWYSQSSNLVMLLFPILGHLDMSQPLPIYIYSPRSSCLGMFVPKTTHTDCLACSPHLVHWKPSCQLC